MSKIKVGATILAVVCLLFLAATGVAKTELNTLVDISVGAGGLLGTLVAIFKKD